MKNGKYIYISFALISIMTFLKIADSDCNCLTKAIEDTNSTFARFLAKGRLRDNDFLSKWEKGQTAEILCEKICGKKGVSLSKINDESNKAKIVKTYSEIFAVAPNYKSAVLIFKFNSNAGLVKHTVKKWDEHHHDLYKSDEFALSHINTIEILSYSEEDTNV